MAEKPQIGVRYCGGCNPRYDRVAAVRQLAQLFPGCELIPVQPGMFCLAAVVVCGCPARCAGVADLDAPLVYLKDAEDLYPAVRELARLIGMEVEQNA